LVGGVKVGKMGKVVRIREKMKKFGGGLGNVYKFTDSKIWQVDNVLAI
jgi:hypothetical protein